MKVFVSYARRDNDEAALREIERQVKGRFPGCTPYIDDLRHGGHADVVRAFLESEVFVAVMSPWYRRTRWTKKEYRWAFASEMPIYALFLEQHLTALAA